MSREDAFTYILVCLACFAVAVGEWYITRKEKELE